MLINGDDVPVAVLPRVVPEEVCAAVLAEAARPPAPGARDEAPHRVITALGPGHWTARLLYDLSCRANTTVRWHLALSGCESAQVAAYAPGEHHDWHVDTLSHGDRVRKLSVVLQLDPADAYVGGDVQLSRFGAPSPTPLALPRELREQGSVLVFPAYLLHRVTPVTSGLRRALVAWVLGPRYV